MSLQLSTHTPEQTLLWRKLVSSNPKRVVATLSLDATKPRNSFGDSQTEIYPALEAVEAVSKASYTTTGAKNEREKHVWKGLVDAGITEMLCQNVEKMGVSSLTLPDMFQGLPAEAKRAMLAPYFHPLLILCNAAVGFAKPPSPTDKKVIAVLKKLWTEIMVRPWQEPENTLDPGDSHIPERMVIAQLAVSLLYADQSFFSVVHNPSDKTIPLLVRHWVHATSADNALVVTGTLLPLTGNTRHPSLRAYLSEHPPPPANILVPLILLGACTTPQTTVAEACDNIIDASATHLNRLTGEAAEPQMEFLFALLELTETVQPLLHRSLRRSQRLWRALFDLVKRSGEDGSVRGILTNVITLVTVAIRKTLDAPEDREVLVANLVHGGLFSALDEKAGEIVHVSDLTMNLSRILLYIDSGVAASPSLRTLIASELPRPRIIRKILEHCISRSSSTASGVPPPDHARWDEAAWQGLRGLQQKCKIDGQCDRRGCEKQGSPKCGACKKVMYCGADCQKRDWKEHKLVCGWKILERREVVAAPKAPVPHKEQEVPVNLSNLSIDNLD